MADFFRRNGRTIALSTFGFVLTAYVGLYTYGYLTPDKLNDFARIDFDDETGPDYFPLQRLDDLNASTGYALRVGKKDGLRNCALYVPTTRAHDTCVIVGSGFGHGFNGQHMRELFTNADLVGLDVSDAGAHYFDDRDTGSWLHRTLLRNRGVGFSNWRSCSRIYDGFRSAIAYCRSLGYETIVLGGISTSGLYVYNFVHEERAYCNENGVKGAMLFSPLLDFSEERRNDIPRTLTTLLNFVSPYFVVSRYASRVKLFRDDPKPDDFEDDDDAWTRTNYALNQQRRPTWRLDGDTWCIRGVSTQWYKIANSAVSDAELDLDGIAIDDLFANVHPTTTHIRVGSTVYDRKGEATDPTETSFALVKRSDPTEPVRVLPPARHDPRYLPFENRPIRVCYLRETLRQIARGKRYATTTPYEMWVHRMDGMTHDLHYTDQRCFRRMRDLITRDIDAIVASNAFERIRTYVKRTKDGDVDETYVQSLTDAWPEFEGGVVTLEYARETIVSVRPSVSTVVMIREGDAVTEDFDLSRVRVFVENDEATLVVNEEGTVVKGKVVGVPRRG